MDQTSEATKTDLKEKYEEIVELLLSAGYFRARIHTLSEFDKVVGGLCWCITSSGVDVDVDILFQENSTIGQKIALSEAIVKALRKMRCPAQIQAFQIQGGVSGTDYLALHPVIVWLVKKFFEVRELRRRQLRMFSMLQFSKNYQFPEEASLASKKSDALSSFRTRKFKRSRVRGEAEETRVYSCLMEYGDMLNGSGAINSELLTSKLIAISVDDSMDDRKIGGVSGPSGDGVDSAGGMSMFDKRMMQAQKDALKEDQLLEEAIKKLQSDMKASSEGQNEDNSVAISGSAVASMIGLSSGEISSAAAAYEADIDTMRKEIEKQMEGGGSGGAGEIEGEAGSSRRKTGSSKLSAFKRQKQSLLKQKQELELKEAEIILDYEGVRDKLKSLSEEKDTAKEYFDKLNEMLQQQEGLEKQASQQKELLTLRGLVALNESYKSQESSFKQSCKSQMQDLKERIAELDKGANDLNDDETRKMKEVEDTHFKVVDKYNKLRQLLATANLEVASAVRTIDDTPTRSELIQYERRFVELYQQISWKLEETRKYYALYNTLETSLSFLQKEVKLLNSISENFDQAMSSPASKHEYLQQVSGIVKNVDESLVKQEGVARTKEQKLDQLKGTHQNLVDEQRRYFKAVKDFQEECNKNEWLMQKMEEVKNS